jgi:hypothetical protein
MINILIGIIGIAYIIFGFILSIKQNSLYRRGIYNSYMRLSKNKINKMIEENKGKIEVEEELNLVKKIYIIYFSLFLIIVILVLFQCLK